MATHLPNPMVYRCLLVLGVLLATLLTPVMSAPVAMDGASTASTLLAATLELYGTFEAMGIVVSLAVNDDPDEDLTATVEYRQGSAPFRAGVSLSRVSDTRLVGSLFWLAPGKPYEVRVTLHDPDGGPLQGRVLTATGQTRSELSVPRPTAAYYVAPDGGGGLCTLEEPCALVEALSRVRPGEEVVLAEGTYFVGALSLPRSGLPGAPITIRGEPGQETILDGGDPEPLEWLPDDRAYRAQVQVAGPQLVLANGQRLYPYESLAALRALNRGLPGFYAEGANVYVRLAGDADPNVAQMVVSRYNHAFSIERNHINLLNLTFRHYGQGEYAQAVYLNNASECLVQGCTFALNNLGIGLKRDSSRNVIQDNVFYDAIFDWPWEAVKVAPGLENGGLRVYDPMTGRGNVIRRNTFHDFFDGLGVSPASTAAVTNETDVYQNLIYRVGDDGIEVDGQASNVRLWSNTMRDVLVGISLAPVYTGPVYALRNLIIRTGAGNNSYDGTPYKFNSGYSRSGPIFLWHNSCDAQTPNTDGLLIGEPGTWAMITSRNNIWAGTRYALATYSASPLNLDYDDLYTTLTGELVWWARLADRHLNTLAELRQVTGQELHGLSVPPGFVAPEPAAGDWWLRPDSPLVDAGVLLPGVNDVGRWAYGGVAPDIGAFERFAGTERVFLPRVGR